MSEGGAKTSAADGSVLVRVTSKKLFRKWKRLFFALELEYRRQRAEGLLLGSSI